MPIRDEGERRIEISEGLTPQEERAILMALERYFVAESPKPSPWVLQGRIDATGLGGLQTRRYAREPWHGQHAPFSRKGVAPVNGRSDVRQWTGAPNVSAILTPGSADRGAAVAAFEADGCSAPRSWGNGPGDRYARHDHREHKVLFCLVGSIVFHTDEGDLELTAGDRIDVPAFTAHAATVGPAGCSCIEAYR